MIQHQLHLRMGRMLEEIGCLRVRKRVVLSGIETAPHGEDTWRCFENGGLWGHGSSWQDFRLRVAVPDDFSGRPLLQAITGREGQWDATNPQFVVRLNGRVEQAFDVNHTTLPLDRGLLNALLLEGYCPPLREDEPVPFLKLTLLDEDEETTALFYDLTIPYEGAILLPEGNRERETTLEILSQAVDRLDLRAPHGAEYAASVRAARAFLQTNYAQKRAAVSPVAVADCVGHTHIDVAWLWDLVQTRKKAVRSFSTVLKLMDRYPEYKFMSSQAVLYDMVRADEPELYARIQKAVADGRWEVEGGMWVEADCNVTSGESLIRQFLYGQKFFRGEFGKKSRILWLPDVFGYSAALPQIMKLCGIDYFMTTKLSWSEFNLAPYDTFLWKGIDGSEVLTHFSPTREYREMRHDEDHGLSHYTTYNALLAPSQIAGGWKRFQQKGLDDHYLVCYGYGDGGGGPTDWMLEHARRMASPAPACPAVRQSFALEFFENLEKRVKGDPRLPKWTGELYLEYHRGTYTAMGRNKRANRKIELALRDTEFLRAAAYQSAALPYPQAALDDVWHDVLTLQFHDILPGSSIEKVYEDSASMYDRCFKVLAALRGDALDVLRRSSSGVTVVNTLSSVRNDIVRVNAPAHAAALRGADGTVYPIQRDVTGGYAYVKDIAPFSAAHFEYVSSAPDAKSPILLTSERFETPFYTGRFDAGMRIVSLVHKPSGRELVRAGEALNRLVCYENKPHQFDAWEMNIYYGRRHWEIDQVERVELAESGPVSAALRVCWRYMNSTVEQLMRFYADIERIDFETTVDWREKQYLVKAHFPLDLLYDQAICDIQFGNVRRATTKNTSWDVARFEVCAHKWVDVGEDGFGVSLLNDCKYGHSIDEDGVALTLLKSSVYPNPAADQETHRFTYALYPHCGGWREANTPAMAYRLNVPLIAADGDSAFDSFAAVDQPNLIVEAVKRAEDGNGVVLRLYECFGRRTNASLRLRGDWQTAEIVNPLEETIEAVPIENGAVRFTMRPYEIKSFRVY